MSSLGIICGTGFKEQKDLKIKETKKIETPWGTPSSPLYICTLSGKEVVLLLRHGQDRTLPPHRINHRANIFALQREVDEIVGVASAGALKGDIPVPSISVPKDYVNLWNAITFFEDTINHITPELSPKLRKNILDSAKMTEEMPVARDSDIYVQTSGPRLETKAEVKVLSDLGDIVGMTMASEATLAKEANMEYAAVVTVDNYANGVGPDSIRYEDIVNTARDNWKTVTDMLKVFIRESG